MNAKPKRRWLPRFGLRWLLIVVTGVCLWLGHEVASARRFVEAESALFDAGGGYYTASTRFTPLKVFHKWLGKEYFETDAYVYLQATFAGSDGRLIENDVTDDLLEKAAPKLRGFRHITHLRLDGSSITDAGLRHLEQLKFVDVIDIRRTNVTSRGVQRLQSALPNCRIDWQ